MTCETFLAYLSRSKRIKHLCGVRLIRPEHHIILSQKDDHGHKRDALVPIDECMILGEAKRICRRQLRKLRFFVMPFVHRPLERRAKHALVSHAWRTPDSAQLTATTCSKVIHFGASCSVIAHFARAASVSRYSSMMSSAISIVFSKSGS